MSLCGLRWATARSREVCQAASLWHLLVEQPELCKKHLVPLLEIFRPEWRLTQRAHEAEEELLHMASCGQIPDRQRWAALVDQLSDDRLRGARRPIAICVPRARPCCLSSSPGFPPIGCRATGAAAADHGRC